jgi:hypothetical protein
MYKCFKWDASFTGLETKAKAEALREMFPNEMQPFTGLETKAKAKALREMFPNGMHPLRD